MFKSCMTWIAAGILIISLTGCEKKPVAETKPAKETKPAGPVQEKAAPAIKDYSKIGFDLMARESVDFLKLGISTNDVTAKLGEPETKSKKIKWEADGLKHQSWTYKAKGIKLDFIDDKGAQIVNMITITPPCTYKTSRNIGIGSTEEETRKIYKDEIDPQEPTDGSSLVAGTVYGGVIFNFKDKKVSSIFIGAGAE